MAAKKLQSVRGSSVWSLAARQHGVVARRQLLAAGLSTKAIKHRVARGRLHRIRRGVYAVGRPGLTQDARWMAAVLACGPGAVLSHGSAAALWKIRAQHEPGIDVTVPSGCFREQTGIRIHRRKLDAEDFDRQLGIPVTSPQQTLVDLGVRLDRHGLEAAVNEADKLNLVDAETLSSSLDRFSGRAGVAALRDLLDRLTFTLTDRNSSGAFSPSRAVPACRARSPGNE